MTKKAGALVLALNLLFQSLTPGTAFGQSILHLPEPGTMVLPSPAATPVTIRGLAIHPENPLLFDFFFDSGKSGFNINSPEFRAESQKMIKYFLAALTIREEDLWVNLSPFEKDRIIPEDLGKTVLGRDMLAQDYILKQFTSSLLYPEKDIGRAFWQKIYARASEQFGTTDIPVDTFNKVWITADKAKVVERPNGATVAGGHLKVMLEEDYLALASPGAGVSGGKAHAVASEVMREIVIPEIEKEVNAGAHFATLRQLFYAMILATWYKLVLKDALLNQVYSDQGKVGGVLAPDRKSKEKIYNQYLEAYKKGVFNYIKDETERAGEVVAHKYFSGGQVFRLTPVMDRSQRSLSEGERREMGLLALETVRIEQSRDIPAQVIGIVREFLKKNYTNTNFSIEAGITHPSSSQEASLLTVRIGCGDLKAKDQLQSDWVVLRMRLFDVVDGAILMKIPGKPNVFAFQVPLPVDEETAAAELDARLRTALETIAPEYVGLVAALSRQGPNLRSILTYAAESSSRLQALLAFQQGTGTTTPGNKYDSAAAPTPTGGIDLNTRRMGLEVDKRGNGVQMTADPAMPAAFRQGHWNGVSAVILQIVPVANLP